MKKIDFLKSSTSSFFELLKKKKDTLEVSIHGIEISFQLPTPLALQLKQFLPLTWQTTTVNPIQVQWVSPEEIHWPHSLDWNEDNDHQCHFVKFLDFHFVVQRDFAVIYKDPSNLILISPYTIDDGFFNFLRWLLPRKLLLKHQYVIHSSCVVLPSGEAILSSGPSGAGKSTLTKMAADDGLFILGDDMNIVSKKSNHWYVEAAAIGQVIQSPDALDLKFPLKSIFSIEKANYNKVEKFEDSPLLLMFSGLTNLFWENLEEKEILQCQNFVSSIVNETSFFNLKFNLDGKVWTHVEQFFNVSKNQPSLANSRQRNYNITP